ncbi:MAG: biotin--[acetyl-CoA-carboxylase] ligase [Clostridia bacterium]|nr:biotin--[acetyl-CoA-carboxylase] ligase [Clostridia bacterium]
MKIKLLDILNSTEGFVSGERLSNLLGVSRTAVWKQINSLKKDGYVIETQPRLGYRLLHRPDLLVKTEILSNLATEKWGKDYLYTFAEVDSTNELAKSYAAKGKPEGTVIIAEKQLQGKGRLGRTWLSPEGQGIWVSIIIRPNIMPYKAPQITFVLAVGMVRTLYKALGIKAQIKWPNDLLIKGKKVAGILTELSAEMERVNYIVFGIGLNVNQKIKDFPEELRNKAISLRIASGHYVSRVQVLKVMLEELERTYNEYLQRGFDYILEEWKNHCDTLGKEVQVFMDGTKLEGKAIDVDREGFLIIQDKENNIHRVIAGDVSLRDSSGNYA